MAEIKFNLLEVDLSTGTSKVVDVTADAKKYLAARGLASKYLFDLPAGIDPLDGANNILHFGVGPLTGLLGGQTVLSFINTINNWAGASVTGGSGGPQLVSAGYNAGLLVKGKAAKPCYILIYDDKVEVRDAADLWGKDLPATNNTLLPKLQAEFGQWFSTFVTSVAGEHMVRYAICSVDNMHSASKWGCGAVMGSKNLKAVAVRGTKGPDYADHQAVWDLIQQYAYAPVTMENKLSRSTYGIETAALSYYTGGAGVKNNHSFWEPVCDTYKTYQHTLPYKPWVTACPGCAFPCMVPYFRNDAKFGAMASKHYYDNTYGAAANCMLTMDDQDTITVLMDQWGMDGEELGGLMAWAMDLYEHGIITKADVGYELPWGDLNATMQLMKDIAFRSSKVGDALADGFYRAIKVFGEESRQYVAETHGCAIDTQDMRHKTRRSNITRYCCSHMGARKHGDYDSALREALTVCNSSAGPIASIWGSFDKGIAAWLNATCGWNITDVDVADYMKRNDSLSRAVSTKQGYNPIVDSTVCERFFVEKVPDKYGEMHGFTRDEFEAAIKKYYVETRGLSEQGLMLKSELQRLGLDFIIPVLEPMGQLA